MKQDQKSLNSNYKLRLAPTPSGYLHVGNGVNFLLTFLEAKRLQAKLVLRIDDYDIQRVKHHFIENIFQTLNYLGITYDIGACSVEEYYKLYSYENKKDFYQQKLKQYFDFTYTCKCSRKVLKDCSIYPQNCTNKHLKYEKNIHNLRIHVKDECIDINGNLIYIKNQIGDVIVWRKNDLPSYNFASLMDDEKDKITHIIRGEDLLFASAIQKYMAKIFTCKSFLNVKFSHHILLYDKFHKKLSKSNSSPSLLTQKSKNELFRFVGKLLHVNAKYTKDLTSLTNAYIELKQLEKLKHK